MKLGESKQIYYFSSEGRKNIEKTVELVRKRAEKLGINNIIVFTANGDGAFLLKKKLSLNSNIKVHAATFPYKQVFYGKDKDGNRVENIAETSTPEIRRRLKEEEINIIQGVMPLQDIFIPGAKDVKTLTIHHTLSLISGGLRLCVQGILMAVDGGHIESGEYVIAMSADTAIVAKSCLSSLLFHPSEGLEISEIICKPNRLTITHSKQNDS